MDYGILLFLLFFLLLFLGIPIAVAIGAAAVVVIFGANLGIPILSSNFYAGIAKFPLLAIPLFILAGFLLERCGISRRIIRLANRVIGRRTGALGVVAVLACVFFGGISGSGPADAAAIGAILIPTMAREGYDRAFSAALIAAGGSTAIIVPPSIALILYGAITNSSIGALFAAGAIPGILSGLALIVPVLLISRKRGYSSETVPTEPLWVAFRDAIWGLLAPVVILGGLYGGIFTPTESAVVAVVYSLFVSLAIYRSLSFRDLFGIFAEACESSAVVMLIVAFATLFSWAGSTVGILDRAASALIGASDNRYVLLLLVNLLLLLAGMLMDAISIYYILLPVLLPIIAHFGWDPVWFGVMMTLNLAIGQFTPPVAVNLYVTTNIGKIPLEDTFWEVIPFVLAMLAALVVIALFPALSTFLPKLFGLT
ncbi:MAG: TRAP transporter large permease [Deltaproteobacteria bacterium]